MQQQGAAFITTGGFDVLFSLLQEYHNQVIGLHQNVVHCKTIRQAASTDLKQLGFSVATRGMESAVEDLSQLLNANSQLVESDDR